MTQSMFKALEDEVRQDLIAIYQFLLDSNDEEANKRVAYNSYHMSVVIASNFFHDDPVVRAIKKLFFYFEDTKETPSKEETKEILEGLKNYRRDKK